MPSGVRGIIMDVKVSARVDSEPEQMSNSDRRRRIKKINEEYRSQSDKVREDLTESLSNILLGEKIPLDVKNGDTDEVVIPANRKITKTLLRRLAAVSKHIEIDPSPVKIKIMEIVNNYQLKFDELDYDRERKIEGLNTGDDADQGWLRASRCILPRSAMQVGDKMAGRRK